MAADVTVIGRGSKVKGRITGEGSLEINGHVEGDVVVSGDVSVGDEGLVGSNLSGRRLVVRGAVKGDLEASEAIALESGARVVGDLRAPRIAVAQGALVRGHVQTSGAGGAARGSSASAGRARPAPAPARVEARAPARVEAPKPVPAAAPSKPALRAKAPPPPVVPVLKKGAKGALKKRAGG